MKNFCKNIFWVVFGIILMSAVSIMLIYHSRPEVVYNKQGIMSPVEVELQDWKQVENWVTVDYILTNKGKSVVVGWTIEYSYAYMNTQGKQLILCERQDVTVSDKVVAPRGGQYYGSYYMTESREIENILLLSVTKVVLE